MKLIIAGNRDIDNYEQFCEIMLNFRIRVSDIEEVMCGMAPGVDLMGKRWAEYYGIPVKEFHADWKGLGNSAGPIRNKLMIDYADSLVAILTSDSKGTKDCIEQAMQKPIKNIFVHFVGKPKQEDLKL